MEDKILHYLDKEMSPAEQEAFEARLEQEPDLAHMLEEEIRTRAAITASAYLERKAQLMARPQAQVAMSKPLMSRPAVWAVAAAVAILLAFWGIQQMNQPLSHQDLYAQNFETVPFPAGGRGGAKNPLDAAAKAYEAQNYEQAVLQLEVLLRDTSFRAQPTAYYFQGLSHLELGDAEAAIASFSKVPDASLYGPAAQWHTALAYLKLEKPEACKKALQQVLKGPVSTYQVLAKSLLESLD